MTLPRSSGCTRTSRTLPRRSARLATWTSSGYWTMPRTRCSRASSSTLGSVPRLGGHGRLGVGRGFLGLGLGLGLLGSTVLRGTVLGGTVLGGTVLGSAVLGSTVLGGLGRLGGRLGRGLLVLGGLALGGRGGEGFLLVCTRRGGAERALGARLPGELLPVPGDLQQDLDRIGGLRAHREPVLDPVGVHFDDGRVGLRVVLADLLDSAPVALGACVCDDDPVVGLPDLAQALQLDLDSHDCGLLPAIDASEPEAAGDQPTRPLSEPGRANDERASRSQAVSITLCQTIRGD